MKKTFQKKICAALVLTLGLCLAAACGKDTEEDDMQDSGLSSPVVSVRPADNTDENTSDGAADTDTAQTDDGDKTDDGENGDDASEAKDNDDASAAAGSDVQIKTAEGCMNGFGDSHTVEITLNNGDIVSYQVYDEDAISKLEAYDTGSSQDAFSFTYTEENGYLTITSVD